MAELSLKPLKEVLLPQATAKPLALPNSMLEAAPSKVKGSLVMKAEVPKAEICPKSIPKGNIFDVTLPSSVKGPS